MVKFTVFASLAALATAVSATQNFKKACVAPYDICGWTLTNDEFGAYKPPSSSYSTPITLLG